MTHAVSAKRRTAATDRQAAHISASDVVIGQDLLELLSSAMYVDPMSIFREYVQNAADAIDAARREGRLARDEPGTVDIEIDPGSRTLRIRDNGTGLSGADFVRRLSALGASAKRGSGARGFRGVGRLAGLAYAQELLFRSRAAANEPVLELRWDGRALKASAGQNESGDVRALIEKIVTVETLSDEDRPAHFFEVELRGVVRLRGDPLLNGNAIADYLAQVAPVPFAPDFSLGPRIVEHLGARVALAPLEIRISGREDMLYRPHRDRIANGNKPPLSISDVCFVEIPDMDGGIAALGWFLHHDYEGALASATLQKGFRLRAGDIQVGGDALLEQEFPEPRFNSWTVGELHVLDRRIRPNGRRDHFEQNAHYANLVNHLTPWFRDIAQRCRTSSADRKARRDLELALEATSEGIGLLRQNSLGAEARDRLVEELKGQLVRADRVVADRTPDAGHEAADTIAAARDEIQALREGTKADPLAHMKPKDRQQYQRFFELIYECSQNRSAAKSLVDRIIARIAP